MGATFLTRVVIENYKSIAQCDVRLGPLCYLVGPNGAGKSNFLDAIRFVADALRSSVTTALRTRGGGNAVYHTSAKPGGHIRVRLEFTLDSLHGHYDLTIGPGAGPLERWVVRAESIGLAGQNGTAPGSESGRHIHRDHLALSRLDDESEHHAVYEALTGVQFYNIRPDAVQDIATHDPTLPLLPNGANLASVFYGMTHGAEPAAERVNEYMRVVLGGLIEVRAEPVFSGEQSPVPLASGDKVGLLFEMASGTGVHHFWPSQVSEGTRRAFGILTALFQGSSNFGPRPSLVAIEEPESQIHPAALAVLRDAMNEACETTQALVTTHSADLLDDKEVPVESLLAVFMESGVTRIAPLDGGSRQAIREKLYTPGELLRIGQIAPAVYEAQP